MTIMGGLYNGKEDVFKYNHYINSDKLKFSTFKDYFKQFKGYHRAIFLRGKLELIVI